MRKLQTDPRTSTDSALLRRFRKKCSIDFVQWMDDTTSAAIPVPGVHRQGHRATLHNVTPKRLFATNPAILVRPIAGVEIALDFVPKAASTIGEQVDDLIQMFDLLTRRLAPWKGRHLVHRIATSHRRGSSCTIRKARRHDLDPQVLHHEPESARLPLPQILGDRVVSATVYYGHKVHPNWKAGKPSTPAQAQARVYIKTTDGGTDLPRNEWRVRMEVTLNPGAAVDVLGACFVGDLHIADYTSIVKTYLRLTTVIPVRQPTFNRVPSAALRSLLATRVRSRASRDRANLLAHGNTALPDPACNIVVASGLDRSILQAAAELRRAMRRCLTGKHASVAVTSLSP